ncbi:response regulator transcription factor [Mucilaginibacter rubeus]|uniref:Response regulator transcription factor n=1 Tax=Mucilaginibacter rubeus TaxID=2027860 RepID=A0AAE6JK19_9SPHI|nr:MULTISPECIES: response regulator transcription factor [Mucilaginibacter]QEM07374.1 response regulator transcription factor [Mucilaginibacter rubeus]QEM19828.1 response regulator transcription factor [Mucilaginibacter gossypii]QTE43470.1 response regulator transcription factor [Mucilaginibacter rubeus]QTE50070.1 response regulator transcription factor [Mucilaginibacter rubeus]QTE55159.1 response regulator transcription factor [Mucilaginibacter rubeus]
MLKEPIQIALVDDHKLFRSGMAALVSNFKRYNILFEAANGQELINTINNGTVPDIVLLDISMPVMDGVEAAQVLRAKHPGVRIIILSMFEDAEKVLIMVKMGVKGYLLKDSEPYEVEEALLKVSQGELYYPEFVTRHLITNFNSKLENIKLNPREIEFLRLTGTELTYKEIAEAMNISVRTVDSYRDQLFEKLQIKSRVGLVLYSIKNKLIEL